MVRGGVPHDPANGLPADGHHRVGSDSQLQGLVADRHDLAVDATREHDLVADLELTLRLEERGFIRRLPNRARALEVLRQPENIAGKAAAAAISKTAAAAIRPPAARPEPANDVIEIPLHGRIAAGVPIEAMETGAMLPVPAALLGAGEHYALEVSGDSMIEAGILDGDYALIRRTDTARDGEIVVALVRGEEATLKYLRRENGRVRLDPANAAYDPQIYRPDEVVVQGKLAGLLRRYH